MSSDQTNVKVFCIWKVIVWYTTWWKTRTMVWSKEVLPSRWISR